MSFFVGGYRASKEVMGAIETAFIEVVPIERRNSLRRIESEHFTVLCYGVDKAIADIVIHDEKEQSWLLALGTPTIQLGSKDEAKDFLGHFLRNPGEMMRDNIDGNYATLAYDGLKDRLIIGSDFNNTTPVFYSVNRNGVLFSSHELPLAKILKTDINQMGFYQCIYLGVTWGDITRFRELYKTVPCQLVSIDKTFDMVKTVYWEPQDERLWEGNFEEVLEKWGLSLREAVFRFYSCAGHRPVIADLTAGEDSRLILSQCHALGIPFRAQVAGVGEDVDTVVAKRASKQIGFDLIVRYRPQITKEQLLGNAPHISYSSDAYQDFTKLCAEFAMNNAFPINDYENVKFGGAPGGEAFRGSYYLRGKAVFPSAKVNVDVRFFTRMKYLLDYLPGLFAECGNDFLEGIFDIAKRALSGVSGFPIGTQIDHLLRMFQTSFLGLKYKSPLYLPLATGEMTRSIYGIPPNYKRGGKLTKACTERLFPELAFIKTQNGVPTIRKTLMRQHLFFPEYISTMRKVYSGAMSRLFKLTQANKWYYSDDRNSAIFSALLNTEPYCNWFASPKEMVTGWLYRENMIASILEQGKNGSCRYIPILGRMVNQELACRWVYGEVGE